MFSSPDAHKSDDSSEEDTDAAASEDAATLLQAALQDVPASTDRKRSEAMATQVLSQQRSPQASPRGSLVAAEALAKPVETSTAAACETPVESCTARKKERVSTAPSQQQSLPDCQGGSPAAAKALQQLAVVSATTDEKQEVHPGSDNWSTEAVVSSRLAAAEASKSEDVAAASKQPITLQTITREVFLADFDDLLHTAGKKKAILGQGSEGVVYGAMHKQTGTLRAVKWCKRAVPKTEVDMLRRIARTRGLGRLIGCSFRRIVVTHEALRGTWRPQSTRQEEGDRGEGASIPKSYGHSLSVFSPSEDCPHARGRKTTVYWTGQAVARPRFASSHFTEFHNFKTC